MNLTIYIKFNNFGLNIENRIFVSEKDIMVNDNHIEGLDNNYIVDKLDLITKNWKDDYINNSIIDGIEYRIKICSEKKEDRVLIFKNNFPEDFYRLEDVLQELYGYAKD